jgi:hypothetical protein
LDATVIRASKYMQQRRSLRILLSIPIRVSGSRHDNHRFSEDSHTLVVNAHGALILLAEEVFPGQILTLLHLKSGERCDCKVVEIGVRHDNKREIGIELLERSPRFWHVGFPPDDWNPRSPYAKGVGPQRGVLPKREPAASKT